MVCCREQTRDDRGRRGPAQSATVTPNQGTAQAWPAVRDRVPRPLRSAGASLTGHGCRSSIQDGRRASNGPRMGGCNGLGQTIHDATSGKCHDRDISFANMRTLVASSPPPCLPPLLVLFCPVPEEIYIGQDNGEETVSSGSSQQGLSIPAKDDGEKKQRQRGAQAAIGNERCLGPGAWIERRASANEQHPRIKAACVLYTQTADAHARTRTRTHMGAARTLGWLHSPSALLQARRTTNIVANEVWHVGDVSARVVASSASVSLFCLLSLV